MTDVKENAVFIFNDKIVNATLTPRSFKVTDDESHDESVKVVTHNGLFGAFVRSSRKKSSEVQETFVENSDAMCSTQEGAKESPDELNFTFSVDLELDDGSLARINLAQGPSGSHNYWWMGAESLNDSSILVIGDNSFKVSGVSEECYDKIRTKVDNLQHEEFLNLFDRDAFERLFKPANVFELKDNK